MVLSVHWDTHLYAFQAYIYIYKKTAANCVKKGHRYYLLENNINYILKIYLIT